MRGSRERRWPSLICAVAVLCAGLDLAVGRASMDSTVRAAAVMSLGEWLACGLLCLPLLLYVQIRQALAAFATRRQLAALAHRRPEFDWRRIEAEARAAIRAHHAGRHAGELGSIALAECQRDASRADEPRSIRPLWVGTRDATHRDTLALLVDVGQSDDTDGRAARRIGGGRRRSRARSEAIWLLSFVDGAWRVTGVEGHNDAYGFATLPNRVSLFDALDADNARRAPLA